MIIMDPAVYVPGKTDLSSLPKDILILLLTRIERDTIQHYRDNDKELEELRFQRRHCNCENMLVRCDDPSCDSKALMGGKYGHVFDDCDGMYSCKCGKTYCDCHISCKDCYTCEICSKHQVCPSCKDMTLCVKSVHKCPYCDVSICLNCLDCGDFSCCQGTDRLERIDDIIKKGVNGDVVVFTRTMSSEQFEAENILGEDFLRLFAPKKKCHQYDEDYMTSPHLDECQVECFCMSGFVYVSNIIQWDDYVTSPMLWCDDCGARSIICIDCQPKVEFVRSEDSKEVTIVYLYPLMKVEKVMSDQIYSWQWTPELADRHLGAFLALRQGKCYNEAREEEVAMARDIGLVARQVDESEIIEETNDLWKVAPIVNSCDGQAPPIPLDMSYDGTNIYCLCSHQEIHSSCNTRKVVRYWGC